SETIRLRVIDEVAYRSGVKFLGRLGMMNVESVRTFGIAVLFGGCFTVTLSPAIAADERYDLVLRNARIVDGTGTPWYYADLAIRGDTIARIAPAINEPAGRVIDIGGR